MQIILLKDIDKLGKKNEIKNVADGYALNFLIPNKLVEQATQEKIKQVEDKAAKVEEQVKQAKTKQMELINKLKDATIQIKAKASDGGKLFAGLTAKDISCELKEQKKLEVDEKFIKLDKHIKDIGEHQVKIDFGGGGRGEVKIQVSGKE